MPKTLKMVAQTPPASSSEVIAHLNTVLKNELTAINQYFLHARMLKHMGFMKLADHEYRESIDEMKHADILIERVLTIGGIPNLQDLGALKIGENVETILRSDLALEELARSALKAAIFCAEKEGDFTTSATLYKILASEEEHMLYMRTQLNLIDTMGLTAYLQTQI